MIVSSGRSVAELINIETIGKGVADHHILTTQSNYTEIPDSWIVFNPPEFDAFKMVELHQIKLLDRCLLN